MPLGRLIAVWIVFSLPMIGWMGAPSALACEDAAGAEKPSNACGTSGSAAGMRIGIDPQTGALTNAPATGGAAAAVVTAPAAPPQRSLAGGGVILETKGTVRQHLTAKVGEDGVAETHCQQSREEQPDE